MFHFCTYFDQRYLTRGMAMIQSLAIHCPACKIWVLCMDDESFRIVMQLALPEIQAISLTEFECANPNVLAVKQQRSTLEYYFTCTPGLPLYVFSRASEVELITYLDADLYFFSDPTPLFVEIGEASIGLVRQHKIGQNPESEERYGIYNVSWVTFRRDATGRECLRSWQDRCIEWCYLRAEDGKFGDQKYLDDWPARFPDVVVIDHGGANLAPWNVAGRNVAEGIGSRLLVDGQRLLFYHFSKLTQLCRWLYNPGLGQNVKITTALRRGIYGRYLSAIEEAQRLVQAASPVAPLEDVAWRTMHQRRKTQLSGGSMRKQLHQLLRLCSLFINGRLLIRIRGKVI